MTDQTRPQTDPAPTDAEASGSSSSHEPLQTQLVQLAKCLGRVQSEAHLREVSKAVSILAKRLHALSDHHRCTLSEPGLQLEMLRQELNSLTTLAQKTSTVGQRVLEEAAQQIEECRQWTATAQATPGQKTVVAQAHAGYSLKRQTHTQETALALHGQFQCLQPWDEINIDDPAFKAF